MVGFQSLLLIVYNLLVLKHFAPWDIFWVLKHFVPKKVRHEKVNHKA